MASTTRSKATNKKSDGAAGKPRFTREQAARELEAMAESCVKLTEDIIEAQTSLDGGYQLEAFAESLRAVVGLRTLLEDLATGILPKTVEVEA